MNIVEHFLEVAKSYEKTPYIWAGDDPSGFDCSGFVIECLKSVGCFPLSLDETAMGLWARYAEFEIDFPVAGALVFRTNEDLIATHVEICLDGKIKIGSNGGGRRTKTVTDAWRQNAFIKRRAIRPKATNRVFVYPFAWK